MSKFNQGLFKERDTWVCSVGPKAMMPHLWHAILSILIKMKWTTKGDDGKMETICMELSLPQFYKFLHEMEKAKTSMEMLVWPKMMKLQRSSCSSRILDFWWFTICRIRNIIFNRWRLFFSPSPIYSWFLVNYSYLVDHSWFIMVPHFFQWILKEWTRN